MYIPLPFSGGEGGLGRIHNHPAPSITIDKLNITDAYQLFLIIKNNNTKEEIKLTGPHIENIELLLASSKSFGLV